MCCVYTKNGSVEVGTFGHHHSTTHTSTVSAKTGAISFLSSFFAGRRGRHDGHMWPWLFLRHVPFPRHAACTPRYRTPPPASRPAARRFRSRAAPLVVYSYIDLCLANSARVARFSARARGRPRGFIQCTSRRQHERCCASAHQSVAPDARGLRWGFAHRRLPNHDLASAAIVSCAAAGYARPFLRGGGTRYSPFECTHGRAHTLPLVGAALHAWYTIKSLGCLRSHAGDQRRHLAPV